MPNLADWAWPATSHGPWPWKNAMSALEKAAQEAMQS